MQHPEPDNSKQGNFDPQSRTQLTAGGTPVAGEFKVGDVIGGDYEVLAWIGAGGMGNVYRVRHTMMNSDYALKTLSADKVTEVAWRRFQNEAQAIARMSHPNIVGIYNLGLHEGRLPFYVMDILEGDTLNDLLRDRGPMPMRDALTLFVELCGGFGYAHKKGIVHRDIKPPNIVLLNKPEASCRAKIVDFGIAKLSGIKDPQNQYLTSAGEVCGSPYYMSPEQTTGEKIDARSDIYSLGCTLFEALTGVPPMRGRSAVDTMMMHQNATAPTLKAASGGRDFPEDLEQVMVTLLAKAPMDRYQTMELVAQDLSAVLAGEKTAINAALNPYAAQMQKGVAKDGTRSRVYQPEQESTAERKSATAGSLRIAALIGAAVILTGGAAGAFWWKNQNAAKPVAATKVIPSATKKAAPPADVHNDELEVGPAQYEIAESALPGGERNMKPPTVSLHDTAPYSDLVKERNIPIRVFKFPTDIVIGNIKIPGSAFPAAGTRKIAVSEPITFMPDPILTKYPQYARRFRPKEIYGIDIDGAFATDELFRLMHGLPGVAKVQFSTCPLVTTHCFKYFKDMPALKSMQFDDKSFTPEEVAQIPNLTKMSEVGFSYQPDATPYLKLIKGSSAIKILNLSKSKIDHQGFEIIAGLPNLERLNLSGCKFSKNDIPLLTQNSKLKMLLFAENKVDVITLSNLKKLKTLKYILFTQNAAQPITDPRLETSFYPIRVEHILENNYSDI